MFVLMRATVCTHQLQHHHLGRPLFWILNMTKPVKVDFERPWHMHGHLCLRHSSHYCSYKILDFNGASINSWNGKINGEW
jgi:hypothetical protein